MKFLKQLFCNHEYEDIQYKMPKPFNHISYPILKQLKNGYSICIGHYEFYECKKCKKIKTLKIYEE